MRRDQSDCLAARCVEAVVALRASEEATHLGLLASTQSAGQHRSVRGFVALLALFQLAAGSVLVGCTDCAPHTPEIEPERQDARVAPDADAGEDAAQGLSDAGAVAAREPAHGDAGVRDAGKVTSAGPVSLVIHELWKMLEPPEDPFSN